MRRAAKIDANQPSIVTHLRRHGWSVKSLAPMGEDFPDLLCARMRFTALAEVKNSAQPANKQKLKKGQAEFQEEWAGVTLTVYSPDDALSKLNAALVRSGACRLEDVNGL